MIIYSTVSGARTWFSNVRFIRYWRFVRFGGFWASPRYFVPPLSGEIKDPREILDPHVRRLGNNITCYSVAVDTQSWPWQIGRRNNTCSLTKLTECYRINEEIRLLASNSSYFNGYIIVFMYSPANKLFDLTTHSREQTSFRLLHRRRHRHFLSFASACAVLVDINYSKNSGKWSVHGRIRGRISTSIGTTTGSAHNYRGINNARIMRENRSRGIQSSHIPRMNYLCQYKIFAIPFKSGLLYFFPPVILNGTANNSWRLITFLGATFSRDECDKFFACHLIHV